MAAAGFALAVAFPDPVGIAAAAILIGAGIAVVTPIGFTRLAATAPADRLGRTMGAGEVGRKLGDAGGPLLVGAFGPIGLGAGLAALATCAVLTSPAFGRRRASRAGSDIDAKPEYWAGS